MAVFAALNVTSVLLLVLSYLLIGIGFGFANAPITNTAVSGLPAAQAGVAGAITSTARQVGSAIAIAGGLAAGATPGRLAQASRPGWLIVVACGLFLFIVARATPQRHNGSRRLIRQHQGAAEIRHGARADPAASEDNQRDRRCRYARLHRGWVERTVPVHNGGYSRDCRKRTGRAL